jgi:hypothetical protein
VLKQKIGVDFVALPGYTPSVGAKMNRTHYGIPPKVEAGRSAEGLPKLGFVII